MQMKGQIIVVTGASKGIGLALTQLLREKGATVIACSRHPKRGDPHARKLDVRSSAAVHACLKAIIKKYKRIDLVINSAGWVGKPHAIEQVTASEYADTMRTNVDGVFHAFHAVLPHMKKRKKGVILTIASRAGSRAHPNLAVYSASKAAVISLTQAVARSLDEAKSPVRCFTFSPGGVATAMRTKLFGKQDSDAQPSPEAIARIIIDCLEHSESIPNGADLKLAKSGELEVVTMP